MDPPAVSPALAGRLVVGASLWLALVIGSSDARAQPAGDEAMGQRALAEGRPADAIVLLSRAYAHDPQPHLLLSLARAHEALGHPHEAFEAYHHYLQAVDDAAADGGWVRQQMARLRSASTVLVLQLRPPDAQLTIDGRPMRPVAGEVLAAPGVRDLRIEAPGYRTYEKAHPLPAGRLALGLALVPDPATAPLAPPPPVTAPPQVGSPPPAPTAPPTVAPPALAPRPAPPTTTPPSQAGAWDAPRGAEPEDELLLGPLATLGFFAPLGIGLHGRYGDSFGFGFDLQGLPPMGSNDLSITSVTALARVHPTRSSLYFSGGFAVYHISASDTVADTTAEGSLTFPALAIGFGLMGREGFVLGVDMTLLVRLGSAGIGFAITDGDPSEAEAELLEASVRDTIEHIRDFLPIVPQINLLRIGYLF